MLANDWRKEWVVLDGGDSFVVFLLLVILEDFDALFIDLPASS